MDGKRMLFEIREVLHELDGASFINDHLSYSYLYEAALAFVQRTHCLRTSQSITTVADQAGYTINGDFLELYMQREDNQFYLPYSDGTTTSFLAWKDYEDIVYQNNTTSVSIPSRFTIIDNPTLGSQITGTATSAGAASGGQCTLTDTAGDFSDAWPGDTVHNTTDTSFGIVLSKTSTTAIVTAIFDGTDNDWSSSDAYVIQPSGRYQLRLDPPPSTAGHTATLHYVQRPAPVYSDYGVYRIPMSHHPALIKYAAWLYKYRDEKPNYGDAFYQYWDDAAKRSAHQLNRSLKRTGFKISFKKVR